jgi:hypothetical protein
MMRQLFVFQNLMFLTLNVTLFALSLSPIAKAQDHRQVAIDKLRQYCAACHGVGTLRFIRSDDDQIFWDSLFTERPDPNSRTWAELIAEVLDWPLDRPYPDFRQLRVPPNKDWMPKGFGRVELSEDIIGDQKARLIITDELRTGLKEHRPLP